jgi:hypothetical protein
MLFPSKEPMDVNDLSARVTKNFARVQVQVVRTIFVRSDCEAFHLSFSSVRCESAINAGGSPLRRPSWRAPRVSLRATILAVARFEIATPETTQVIEKAWNADRFWPQVSALIRVCSPFRPSILAI